MLSIKRKITILIISLIIINIPYITNEKTIKKVLNNKNINNIPYINQEKAILSIYIPKINLHKKIYSPSSKENNINKNIKILSDSNPNNNTYILAAHSGTNYNAYFNKLHLLNIKDTIYIYKDNNIYIYKIIDKYYINKTGYLEIEKNLNNTLVLITCSTKDKSKQLIVESKILSINNVK